MSKPQFNAVVTETNKGKSYYTDIGAAWLQTEGKGISVRLIPQVASNSFALFTSKDIQVDKIADRLNVCVVEQVEGKDPYWHVVGTAFYFENANASGYNIVAKGGLVLSGSLYLQVPKPKQPSQQPQQ